MRSKPTAYKLVKLAAMMGQTSRDGMEEALRAYIRAEELLDESGKLNNESALSEFMKGMPLAGIPYPPQHVTFRMATDQKDPNYIGSDKSIRKYAGKLNNLETGKPLSNAEADRLMERYRSHGIPQREVKELLAIRKEIKAVTGRKNRSSASRQPDKRKSVK